MTMKSQQKMNSVTTPTVLTSQSEILIWRTLLISSLIKVSSTPLWLSHIGHHLRRSYTMLTTIIFTYLVYLQLTCLNVWNTVTFHNFWILISSITYSHLWKDFYKLRQYTITWTSKLSFKLSESTVSVEVEVLKNRFYLWLRETNGIMRRQVP